MIFTTVMDYQEFISFMLEEQVGIFPRIKSEIRRGIILDELEELNPDLETSLQEFRAHGDIVYANSGCNIIASTGSRTGKYIGIGAHYDIRAMTPGANDNTSGVAVLLDLVERFYLKGPENVGIRFMFFDCEEDGKNPCQGSKHYIDMFGIDDIIGLYNLDMVGVGDNIILWGYNGHKPNLRSTFADISGKAGCNVVESKKGLQGKSDHYHFREHVEAMTVTAIPDSDLQYLNERGFISIYGELLTDNHSKTDCLDKLSIPMMKNIASVVYESVMDIDKDYSLASRKK